ncbi:four helix bundle protein [Candidatus Peregrinibacteria bacterium]|nr:four helix bundle protein [Candidatus Peregrinibacteria bacterium]
MIYDLEERLCEFSKSVLEFVRTVPDNLINRNILSQLIRAGTSIGANYCEADNAESKKDFIHKIGICRKETKETKYWLKIIESVYFGQKEKLVELQQEAKELNLIFNAMYIKLKKNNPRFL